MKTIMITETLKQAESLKEMANKEGKRRIGLPFYHQSEDRDTYFFNVLDRETNYNWLKNMISQGRIWLRHKTDV